MTKETLVQYLQDAYIRYLLSDKGAYENGWLTSLEFIARREYGMSYVDIDKIEKEIRDKRE